MRLLECNGSWGILARDEGQLGEVPVGRTASWGKLLDFRAKFLSLNWHSFPNWQFPQLALPQLALPPTGTSPNWPFPNWHFPQMALPLTGTSPNWHFPQLAILSTGTFCNLLCYWEIESPTAGTPVVGDLAKLNVLPKVSLTFTREYHLQRTTFKKSDRLRISVLWMTVHHIMIHIFLTQIILGK